MEYQEIINFVNQLCAIANQVSKKYFRLTDNKILQEMTKEDDSAVTFADREIERLFRQEIINQYPTHGIIGEEFGNHQTTSDYVWIIDPIDGTSSFITGKPIFGNLIALAKKNSSQFESNNYKIINNSFNNQLSININNNSQQLLNKNNLIQNLNEDDFDLSNYQIILGVINQPINNERWLGIDQSLDKKNFGSYFNNQKITTRNCHKINDAVMCSTSPVFFDEDDYQLFLKLAKLTKYQKNGGVIYGGDCYSYGCLAMGLVDIIIEPKLKIYDFASHIPIIKNAGGMISDWQGSELQLKNNTKLLACSNKILHHQVLELMN